MMWQDLIFLGGSVFSLVVLAPTLAESDARVPLATSAPSALIGGVYGLAFFSLGMTFSGIGALATGIMWSGICLLRSPTPFGGPAAVDETPTQSHAQPDPQPAD